ncbi:MAG: histidine phosphatase family protein [Dongiaceae bacterium]
MLYLVRHGETIWNAAGRYQGRLDSPLTERGRAQADAVGWLLAKTLDASERPLRSYASPADRALETAAIMARHVPLDSIVDARLGAVTAGSWDGMTEPEIEKANPGVFDGSGPLDYLFCAPGGERFEAVSDRVAGWLKDCQAPAVIVSHGLILRIVRGLHLGLSRPEMLAFTMKQDAICVLGDGAARIVENGPPAR